MKATYQKPTGFSDPRYYEIEVEIVGYCYGWHRDAGAYDRGDETVMAIFVDGGRFDAAPLSHFKPAA